MTAWTLCTYDPEITLFGSHVWKQLRYQVSQPNNEKRWIIGFRHRKKRPGTVIVTIM